MSSFLRNERIKYVTSYPDHPTSFLLSKDNIKCPIIRPCMMDALPYLYNARHLQERGQYWPAEGANSHKRSGTRTAESEIANWRAITQTFRFK